ncbi:MAG: hypothetical protein EZS28_040773, partial [Streblomastix strix]
KSQGLTGIITCPDLLLPFAETDPEIQQKLQELEDQIENEKNGGIQASKKEDGKDQKDKIQEEVATSADLQQLTQFFKKANKVTLDRMAIEHEHARLARENADLREILRQYLEGIGITEAVSSSANPLMVVQPAEVNVVSIGGGQQNALKA